MSSYQVTFKIFKQHPLGIIAIVFWVIESIINILDFLVVLFAGLFLEAFMDLIVIVALVLYIVSPAFVRSSRDPIKKLKAFFIGFSSVPLIAEIIYGAAAGFYVTVFYWIAFGSAAILLLFTILGVFTTLKEPEVKRMIESQSYPPAQPMPPYSQSPAVTPQFNVPKEEPVTPVPTADSVTEVPAKAIEEPMEPPKLCPNCNAKNSPTAKFCGNCGSQLS